MSKKDEKKCERLKREMADRNSKARSDSQARQERIKVLWYEIRSGHLIPKEKEIARELAESELVRSLTELADKQQREIEYLTQFRCNWELIRDCYPDQLENLYSASLLAFAKRLKLPTPTPKEVYEHKRRSYKWPHGIGLIEYEFGGAREAESKKLMLRFPSALGPYAPAYQPRCLDDILRGGVGEVKMLQIIGQSPIAVDTVTNMRRLQALFGMDRKRFPKNLPRRRMGTQIVYNWRAVVKIMDALLIREKPSDRTTLARGAPRRLWLSDPALRARVLSRIEARLKNLSAPEHIQAAFLDVIRHHLPDSAKK